MYVCMYVCMCIIYIYIYIYIYVRTYIAACPSRQSYHLRPPALRHFRHFHLGGATCLALLVYLSTTTTIIITIIIMIITRSPRDCVASAVEHGGESWSGRVSSAKRTYSGWHYLSSATCLRRPRSFYALFHRVRDRNTLLHDSPFLQNTCVRQVVLDK